VTQLPVAQSWPTSPSDYHRWAKLGRQVAWARFGPHVEDSDACDSHSNFQLITFITQPSQITHQPQGIVRQHSQHMSIASSAVKKIQQLYVKR
jgi:hypothetical protein